MSLAKVPLVGRSLTALPVPALALSVSLAEAARHGPFLTALGVLALGLQVGGPSVSLAEAALHGPFLVSRRSVICAGCFEMVRVHGQFALLQRLKAL